MEYTQNYQLPLWDKEDAVIRTDFNENNQKIDAAVGAIAASAAYRNCRIEYGSYTGSGTYGSSNAQTLHFSGRPLVVMIFQITSGYRAIMGNPAAYGHFHNLNTTSSVVLDWGATSVTWYSKQSEIYQMNDSGINYSYFALLAADE